jgi:cytochrome oxidase Cu insertion factor (SCO1/SenC/PrrC family)
MPKSLQLKLIIFSFLVGLIFGQSNYSLAEDDNLYKKIENIEIVTKSGSQKLSDIYSDSPLIIGLIFTRCSGICYPSLINLKENIESINTDKEYRILIISFDKRDSVKQMDLMAESYDLNNDSKWIFAVSKDLDLLTKSIAFEFTWDSVTQQFEHEAMLVGIDNEGIIKQKLIGMRDRYAMISMISTINSGFYPSRPLPSQNALFSCFEYDPEKGEYKIGIGLYLIVMPFFLTIFIVFIISSPLVRAKDVKTINNI